MIDQIHRTGIVIARDCSVDLGQQNQRNFSKKIWIELTLQLYGSMDLVWVFVDSGKHNEQRHQETNCPPRYRTSVYAYVCSMTLSHVLTPPLFFCITVFTIQPAYLCAFKVISATIQFTIFIVLIHWWNAYITYTCNCTKSSYYREQKTIIAYIIHTLVNISLHVRSVRNAIKMVPKFGRTYNLTHSK